VAWIGRGVTDTSLFGSLMADAVIESMRDVDRLATLAIFGEDSVLAEPQAVAFNAGALELVAIRLEQGGAPGATDACREAFELLRGVLQDRRLADERTVEENHRLLLRAAGFGVLADLPSQTRQLLQMLDEESAAGAQDWGRRAHLSTLLIWLRLIRKQGWDDLDEIHRILAGLREEQALLEPNFLAGQEGRATVAWDLVASYHLVRAAEIVTEFTENGSSSGHFDPVEQAQMHFDRSRRAADEAGDPQLLFLTIILELVATRLVSNSIWTVSRSAGTRAQRFVQQLSSRGRPRPILELLPPQRRALVDAGLIGTGRRSVVVSLPTSAGKTLVAEFRILQALDRYEEQKGWVAYTAPTRALVNHLASPA